MKMKRKSRQDSKLQRFKSALDQTADSVFITDKEGIIEYVNPAFEKMTGFSAKEALGHTPRIIKSGLQDLKYYKKLWSTILSGKTFRTIVVNKRKDGKLFYADHTITPIKNNKGKVTHFVGIWKDITAQVELDKRKDEFIAIASHELKNPLSTTRGYLELLHERLAQIKDEKSMYLLSQIEPQTDKIINLINDFFDANKIKAGKMVIRKINLDLDKLVEKVVEDFKQSSKVKIVIEGKVGKKILADPERIGQVLINLLSNAAKYSSKGAKIIVRLAKTDKQAVVSVQDFGIGIPKSEIKKVFERFYKIDPTERAGFGLGLYIASEIVKGHKGKIWVESKIGKGSTFFFTLPL